MARTNDASHDCRQWSNAKLMREARSYANLTNFGSYFRDTKHEFGCQADAGDFIREETRLYRATWLEPLLDEIERRFVKAKAPKPVKRVSVEEIFSNPKGWMS